MKRILFVCVENSCRSQMAEGLARGLWPQLFEAYSAGSHPSGMVNPCAVEAMKEVGIDISGFHSKGFSDLPARDFDYVITLGCGDTCPFFAAKQHREWQIDDPESKGIEYFRAARDAIKERIGQLVKTLA